MVPPHQNAATLWGFTVEQFGHVKRIMNFTLVRNLAGKPVARNHLRVPSIIAASWLSGLNNPLNVRTHNIRVSQQNLFSGAGPRSNRSALSSARNTADHST
jgi:hypothetical protein